MAADKSKKQSKQGSMSGSPEKCSTRFLGKLQHEWVRNPWPDRILVSKDYSNSCSVKCKKGLKIRYSQKLDEDGNYNPTPRVFKWAFEVTVRTPSKYLKRVVLKNDIEREKFVIGNIKSNALFTTVARCPYYVELKDLNTSNGERKAFKYWVTIQLETSILGTYCQDIIFDFAESAAIIRSVCAELTTTNDLERLSSAKDYLQFLAETKNMDKELPLQKFDNPSYYENYLLNFYKKPNPDSFSVMLCTLKDRDFDIATYRQRMHELLYLEEIAMQNHMARYNIVGLARLYSTYSESLDDASTITRYPLTGELFAEFPLGREITEDTRSGRLLLRSCNRLIVTQVKFNKNNEPSTIGDRYEALIERKFKQKVLVRLSKQCVADLKLTPDTNVHMSIEFTLNRLPMCEWHRAIDSLADPRLVFPDEELSANLKSFLAKSAVWCDDWNKTLGDKSQLNESQKKAVIMMMTPLSIRLPPILIMGPYGTGKTSTIAQALKILLVNEPNSKVLLCTQSNSAADLYIKNFFDIWFRETGNPKLKPLRIYYTGRAVHTVSPTVRKYCLIKEPTQPNAPIGPFLDPTPEDIEAHSLVICTLATSSHLMPLGLEPTHVVIDEAAQAFECEILSCFSMTTERTRIVLAGDDLQLAPEVSSDLACDRGLNISMLERLHYTYENRHPCCIRLTVNYRAHQDIVRMTSILFYLTLVEPGIEMQCNPKFSPITFFACQGEVLQGASGTGYYNRCEARMVADKVCQLKETWPAEWGPFDAESIGVLSHYGEQVAQIRQELRQRSLGHVTVERVLNVQGKQYTVVFISIVRTLEDCDSSESETKIHDYGFLSNKRLLNTAITRARCAVAVVGDPRALVTVGICRSLWQTYLRAAILHHITADEVERHIANINLPRAKPKKLNPNAEEFVPRAITPNPLWIEYVPVTRIAPVVRCPKLLNVSSDSSGSASDSLIDSDDSVWTE